MSEVKKIATRDSYGNALVELGKEHENLIVLDADLAGATKTCIFQKEFPERHWDCGIAECNMTGIAAGLSTCGKVPFISSFAMFAAGRNYEQVRNSIGYPHLNVKIFHSDFVLLVIRSFSMPSGFILHKGNSLSFDGLCNNGSRLTLGLLRFLKCCMEKLRMTSSTKSL